MSEEKRFVKVELELPKEVFDFLMLALGDEGKIKDYLKNSIAGTVKSDFESLLGGGVYAETLHDRFKETILKSLEAW